MNSEQSLIGILMREPRTIDEALACGLKVSHFTDPLLGRVFDRMLSLDAENRPWDLATIGAGLPEAAAELVDLDANAPVAQNASYFANEVVTVAWSSAAVAQLSDIVRRLARRAPFEASDALKAQLSETVTAILTSAEAGSMATLTPRETMLKVLDEYEEMKAHREAGKRPGYSTGLETLDLLIGGLRKRGLYVVGGRAGMGKTAIAVHLARSAAEDGAKVVYFTIEMGDSQIAMRMVAADAMVPTAGIMDGDLTEEQEARLFMQMELFGQANISVNDRAGHTIETFEEECRRLARLGQIDMAIIDYVQLMNVGARTFPLRTYEVAEISRRLKRLALSLKIPVVALAQISREVTKRDNKRPTMADIRDSGSLEQDADGILLLHRPSYYGEDGDDEINVAKNRYGKSAPLMIESELRCNRFREKK